MHMAKGMRGYAARAGRAIRRAREWMMDYAYLVTLGAMIAVIAASAMYTRHLRAQEEENVQAAAHAPEIGQTDEITPTPIVSPLPTIAPIQVHYMETRPGGTTVWPVSGKVLRGYEPNEPVVWEALSCVQVHAGLDIAGEAEEDVLCAMDGVVQRTVRDDLWGWRVYVDQTDGRTAMYAGLLLCGVEAGQSVTRGQVLGTLMSEVPCEAELGPHLHMELFRDGVPQDPQGMMPE